MAPNGPNCPQATVESALPARRLAAVPIWAGPIACRCLRLVAPPPTASYLTLASPPICQMPASGLNDDQVRGELLKMVEFIKKEAEEKAKEIRVKANEEYESEKSSLVRSETATIDQQFAQRYKQAGLAQQIVKSTVANKTRLKVLAAKEDIVDSVVQTAAKKIADVPKDASKYEKLLTGLIEESALVLKENAVVVKGRKADASVVKKAAEAAAAAIKKSKGKEVKITVSDSFLDEKSAGGVIVYTSSGKISVDNTLEERLKIVTTKALPLIRLELFGPSADRKFFD